MNEDDLVAGLRARMDKLPEVVVPQDRVWAGVRRRRGARVAAIAGAGALAVGLGAVAAIGAPWSSDPAPPAAATSPEPTPRRDPATAEPAPTPTSLMDCVAPEPTPGGPIEDWTQELQDTVLPFLIKIDEVMQSEPGYVETGVLYDPIGLEVLSANPLPPAVDVIAAEAEAAGVRVVYTQTLYGGAELEAAAVALGAALRAEGIEAHYIAGGSDFSVLEVGGPVISTDCATQARVREIARETIGDIPIAIVIGKGGIGVRDPELD